MLTNAAKCRPTKIVAIKTTKQTISYEVRFYVKAYENKVWWCLKLIESIFPWIYFTDYYLYKKNTFQNIKNHQKNECQRHAH